MEGALAEGLAEGLAVGLAEGPGDEPGAAEEGVQEACWFVQGADLAGGLAGGLAGDLAGDLAEAQESAAHFARQPSRCAHSPFRLPPGLHERARWGYRTAAGRICGNGVHSLDLLPRLRLSTDSHPRDGVGARS